MDTISHHHHHSAATSSTKAKVHGSGHGHGSRTLAPSSTLHQPKPHHTAYVLQPAAASPAAASPAPVHVAQVPSSVVVQKDPQFGQMSPATTTATATAAAAAAAEQGSGGNNTGLVGPIVGSVCGALVLVSLVAFMVLKKKRRKTNNPSAAVADDTSKSPWVYPPDPPRKDSESGQSMAHENSAYTLQPPPAYTSKEAKRLTVDTLISMDQRSSLSTTTSKRQYMPQLAYSPSKASLTQREQELGVSPSHTLIGPLSASENDNDSKHGTKQRVPSYQPQVLVQPEETETTTTTTTTSPQQQHDRLQQQQQQQQQQPPPEADIQNYYNYLSQNEDINRSPDHPEDRKA